MSGRIFCAIDNGVTGTLGAVDETNEWSFFMKVPTYSAKEYMKSKDRNMTHVDYDQLCKILKSLSDQGPLVIVTERPLVNPRMFKATMSGVRAHEVLLAALRSLKLDLYATWDSRDWQHEELGDFDKGESKQKSLKIGLTNFPEHAELMKKHGDADGLHMARRLRATVLKEEAEKKQLEKESDND